MRSRILARTLVSAVTVLGIAAGTAGTSIAASEPVAKPAGSGEISLLATQNFGLSSAQAKNVQRWLKEHWNYNAGIDGQLGTNSWKAYQRCLQKYWGYEGNIDGDPGTGTVKALQRQLKATSGYDGEIDGDAGPKTRAAFKRFADAHA
ncbi:peptidoglycan-binding domain-containing protein [Streptomyces lanatus]|uniref:Peptidoglycan-binding domain-containing protein n=1 Tax=Streptomyces lanatus TaxID=66900 RepID=A0ABV1XUY1_9ACTN|nr:peptidoglycan-binding domain-containing protein [Streptomyces lanatus]GHH13208.1 hypothetical protein GCM10018780_52660 [Streptomyces lanatus]